MYRATVNGTEIVLVDTPGFDDSGIENLEILRGTIGILHFLAIQKSCFPIHGIVFLHDISEVKFSGSQRKTLSILRALCGEKCMGNVIVGTTRWSPEKPAKFKKEEQREQKFLGEHWGGVYMTKRWIDEDDSDVPVQIVTDLLAKPQILLLSQEEMLKPPHAVEDTTVGKLVVPEADLEMKQNLAEKEQEFKEEMAKRSSEAEEMRRDYKEKMEQFQRGRAEDKVQMEADVEKIKKDHKEQYQKERAKDAELMKKMFDQTIANEKAKTEADAKRQYQKGRTEGVEQTKKMMDQKIADEKADAEKQKMGRGQVELLYDKFKAGELSFAEKFGLAIAAPIILAPAAFVAAPVGVIASLVHLAEKLNK